jgi:hypothetical protein
MDDFEKYTLDNLTKEVIEKLKSSEVDDYLKIAVEFPVNIFRKYPTLSVGFITEPKLKLKFTINIPKIAYALAKSNPIIRCCIFYLSMKLSIKYGCLDLQARF